MKIDIVPWGFRLDSWNICVNDQYFYNVKQPEADEFIKIIKTELDRIDKLNPRIPIPGVETIKKPDATLKLAGFKNNG